MKVTYKVKPSLIIEFDAKDQKEVFKTLGSIDDAHGVQECGCCGGTDLRYQAREVDGNNFYEMVCKSPDCRAKLAFGQVKGSSDIYPRRKYHDKHPLVVEKKVQKDSWMKDGGWEKYQPKG